MSEVKSMNKKMESMKSQRRKINKKENEFSKVNFPDLRKTRKIRKEMGEKRFMEGIRENLSEAIRKKYIKKEDQFEQMNKYSLIYILSGRNTNVVKNYYINSEELFSFFENTKIKKEIFSHIISLTNSMLVHDPIYTSIFHGVFAEKILNSLKHFTCCIHAKNINRSIFCIFQRIELLSQTIVRVTNGDREFSGCHIHEDALDFMNQSEMKEIRLVLNMLFYMDAFPDKILDSPPAECIDKLNCNNSKTITMYDEIRDYLHENRDVSPHLRRGYFKYLASDFYKNKKGQTIFVKSSFVKGQAKTIIE
jgi:hypothetical protein